MSYNSLLNVSRLPQNAQDMGYNTITKISDNCYEVTSTTHKVDPYYFDNKGEVGDYGECARVKESSRRRNTVLGKPSLMTPVRPRSLITKAEGGARSTRKRRANNRRTRRKVYRRRH